MKNEFVTAINCMDGRTQIPVNEYLKQKYSATYVDTITEPGPIKDLAIGVNSDLWDSYKKKINISVYKHGSNVIAIVGHFDCAGNPIGKDEQIKQIKISCNHISSNYSDIEVIGLWVDKKWQVEEV